MSELKNKIFELIERNSVDIEESSKNGIIAHQVDVDELVDDLFSLHNVSRCNWFERLELPYRYLIFWLIGGVIGFLVPIILN
jgi:hypothetical protein|tara:strand:- start:101 stop:346 length:246 start_codon:yes stop_codon:yes gene_type:complete